jgi:hypothetical protein
MEHLNDTVLAKIPAMEPPPGMTPNFVNPDSLYPFVIATCTLCLMLTTPALVIRMFTKIHVAKKVNWADC